MSTNRLAILDHKHADVFLVGAHLSSLELGDCWFAHSCFFCHSHLLSFGFYNESIIIDLVSCHGPPRTSSLGCCIEPGSVFYTDQTGQAYSMRPSRGWLPAGRPPTGRYCLSVHRRIPMLPVCPQKDSCIACLPTKGLLYCLSVHKRIPILCVCPQKDSYIVCLSTKGFLYCVSVHKRIPILCVCPQKDSYIVCLPTKGLSCQILINQNLDILVKKSTSQG